MFLQALTVSLRIIFFRAGPQDFPFSTTRGLSFACIGLALVINAGAAAIAVPPVAAFLTAVAIVGSYAFTARSALRRRDLMNRYAQTLNALLATNILFTLAMIPILLKVAPQIIGFYHQLEQNPDLINDRDKWPHLDGGLSLLMDILFLWQCAVSAWIFRQAANATMFTGVLLVLLVGLVTLGISFVLSLFASLTALPVG